MTASDESGRHRQVLFADVASTSAAVAATSSRTEKRDVVAEVLRALEPDEIEPVVGFLVGEPRQGRIGVGWSALSTATMPGSSGLGAAGDPVPLTVISVDRTLSRLAALGGAGSAAARRELLGDMFDAASAEETSFLVRLLGGELRHGASSGVMVEAVAAASSIASTVIRRAIMLGGDLGAVARVALVGGPERLAEIGLEVGRPLQPMLASTAPSATDAVASIGWASVEWKLDGIRIQVHRRDDEIRVWTRNLNEITERLPAVVDAVRSMPARELVLDGEALALDPGGRPQLFQDTVSWRRGGSAVEVAAGEPAAGESADVEPVDVEPVDVEVSGSVDGPRPYFFDVLHCDGVDLIDLPLSERAEVLTRVAGPWRVPATLTDDPVVAESVLSDALGAGHEGVVVKSAESRYEAGRRGKAWRKVKPVHTLDLIVLGVEWGHGRRTGWLSNLHLGARADDGSGFVMVGKTFKGLTDELLRWQTERFLGLRRAAPSSDTPSSAAPSSDTPTGDDVVWVRPEQVVEVAIDGVQRSTRYPGGVALRFARVVRYRDDKSPDQVDQISTVSAMIGGTGG